MRSYYVPLIALGSFALHAQTVEDRLKSARENIDAHAIVHTFDPPTQSTETRWHVNQIDGCTMEMTQTWHHDAADGAVTHEGIFDVSEDKVVTWTFDLASLRPLDVVADTSEGLPHLLIFAPGDAFHLKTDFTSKMLRKDGTTAHANSWSAPGNDRNLWMFFGSPDVDNKAMVKALQMDLHYAIRQCAGAKLITKGDNSRHARQVARQLETIP
jgi:hypothetical protein